MRRKVSATMTAHTVGGSGSIRQLVSREARFACAAGVGARDSERVHVETPLPP